MKLLIFNRAIRELNSARDIAISVHITGEIHFWFCGIYKLRNIKESNPCEFSNLNKLTSLNGFNKLKTIKPG